MKASQIAQYSRTARGVRVMNVDADDRIVDFAIVPKVRRG